MTDPRQPCAPDEQTVMNELTVGWVLGSLDDPDDEVAVLTHLPVCLVCDDVARDTEVVAGLLATTVPPLDPPMSHREALLRRVAATPQEFAASTTAPATPAPAAPERAATVPATTAPSTGSVPPRPTPLPQRPSPSRHRIRTIALVAAAVIGVLAVGGRYLAVQVEMQATADAQVVTRLLQDLGQPGGKYAVLLDAEDRTTVGAVTVTDGYRQVYTVGLAENATDRDTYVLWGLRPGFDPDPLGTFDVTRRSAVHPIGTAMGPKAYTDYAISREPGRVAPSSPTLVIASGQVAPSP